jgi:hypothetical protein
VLPTVSGHKPPLLRYVRVQSLVRIPPPYLPSDICIPTEDTRRYCGNIEEKPRLEIFTFRRRSNSEKVNVKGKAIPLTGRGGPQDCETSRLLQVLDIRLTDSVTLSVLSAGRPLPLRKIPGTHFC